MHAGKPRKHNQALLRTAVKNRNAAWLRIQPGTGYVAVYIPLPAGITDL
jgi:hypothetical protein